MESTHSLLIPTKDDLIKVIDDSLAEIKNASTRPGWTPWLLGGTIIGLTASAYDQWLAKRPQSEEVIFSLLFLRVLYDLFSHFAWIRSSWRPSRPQRRFIEASTLVHVRPILAYEILVSCSLIAIAINSVQSIGFDSLLAIGFYLAHLILCLSFFLITFLKGPQKQFEGRSKLIMGMASVGHVLGLCFLGLSSKWEWNILHKPEVFKVSASIAFASILISFLILIPSVPSAYSALRRLKHALWLGEISVVDAKTRFLVIDSGSTLVDVLEPSVRIYLDKCAECVERYERLNCVVEPFVDVSSLDENQKKFLIELFEGIAPHMIDADEAVKMLPDLYQDVHTVFSSHLPNLLEDELEMATPLDDYLKSSAKEVTMARGVFIDNASELTKRCGLTADNIEKEIMKIASERVSSES